MQNSYKYTKKVEQIISKGISLYELALDVGVSESSMYKYRNNLFLSRASILKIENYLKTV